MKNMNKNSIKIAFKILSIGAFILILVPTNKAMAMVYPTYVMGGFNDDNTYTMGHFVWSDEFDALNENGTNESGLENKNPIPKISSISPKSGNTDVNINSITISGKGFTPTSIARINNSVRSVTFIDPSHLLMPISNNELYIYQNDGGFFVAVFNDAPGGGYSNAVYFTIEKTNGSSVNDKNSNSLAASILFGTDGILPSGLISWILFGMMILVIVILARKVFGAQKKYRETPLKHA